REVAERLEWVLERTDGRGADVTIEATGTPDAAVQAMRFVRDAGRVVIVGQYTDHGETSFNPHLDLNKKHLDVRGCWGSDFSHFSQFGNTWERGICRTINISCLTALLQSIPRANVPHRGAYHAIRYCPDAITFPIFLSRSMRLKFVRSPLMTASSCLRKDASC